MSAGNEGSCKASLLCLKEEANTVSACSEMDGIVELVTGTELLFPS
jgi:hypothetical protein